MNTHCNLKSQHIKSLNKAIDIGLHQLKAGKSVPAQESYERMRKKIDRLAKKAK